MYKNIWDNIKNFFVKKTDENQAIKIFKSLPLFKGMNYKELHKIYEQSTEINLNNNEFLFHEGDEAQDIYVLISGTLEILKKDEKKRLHHLSFLHGGDSVGEMGLLDEKGRSSSARAVTDLTLYKIPFTTVKQISGLHTSPLYLALSQQLSQRLRITNETTIRALESKLEESRMRVLMGNFLIYIIAVVCMFTFFLSIFTRLIHILPASFMLTLPVLFIYFIVFYCLIRSYNMPYSHFGLNLKDWQKALLEGFVFTLPLLGLALIIKLIFMHYLPDYPSHKLFDPFFYERNYTGSYQLLFWLSDLMIYIFIAVPLQEFISRGVLQSSLQFFLTGKHKIIWAIIISNLLFSTGHIYLSIYFALLTFITGLYLGWLYSRYPTLLGVWFAHCMLGVFALFILGI